METGQGQDGRREGKEVFLINQGVMGGIGEDEHHAGVVVGRGGVDGMIKLL